MRGVGDLRSAVTRQRRVFSYLCWVGKRCVLILGLTAGLGCDNDYPLAPTPCDDYCVALQRANCPEDWPEQCVSECELVFSPTRFPDCAPEFDTLVACYQGLGDDDFECSDERSVARAESCEEEQFQQRACLEPIVFRCRTLCERFVEHCEAELEPCLLGCHSVQPGCEELRVR